MLKKDIEIISPSRNLVVKPSPVNVSIAVPGERTGCYLESSINRWQYEYRARTVDALARLNNSEATLYKAQTAVVEATIQKKDALFRLEEQPEVHGHHLAVRRIHRANEIREAQHTYEIDEQRRRKEYTIAETEVVHAKAKLTHARTVLLDAQQQYEAQAKYGGTTHELHHKKQIVELLQIELEAEERRALLRSHNVDLGEDDRRQRELVEETSEQFEQELNEYVEKMFAKR